MREQRARAREELVAEALRQVKLKETEMKFLPFVLLVALGAGCAAVPPGFEPEPPPPVSENIAVAKLMEGARADIESGELSRAAAALERALRIEPRNPRLWQELARLRLRQGDYGQAESLAARSNSWAGDERRVRVANWRLIAEARAARGDVDGETAALERAAELER